MSCVPTPTATQFSTVVSSSVSTSFSEQVTSLPATTSTQLITSCLSSADLSISGSSLGIGTCASSTVITSTTVIGGGVSTTQVPFEITSFVTSTVPTNTLFAPCSSTDTSTSTSSSSTTSQPPSTQFSDTSSTVTVTPTTTITSSQASTLSDGQVTQIIVTLTSALPPTDSVISSLVPIATTQADDGDGGSSALGPVVGGTLGGLAGLLAIIAAVWFFRRRRVNFDEFFEKDYKGHLVTPSRGRMLDLEDDSIPVRPVGANTQPKPYVYGLVGAQPPVSLNAAIVPAAGTSRPESVASHTRTSSTAPLMNNSPASRPGSSGDSNHGGGGTPGVSPSPSFTPPAPAGARSTSPGPLGVQIPTGPAFTEPPVGGGGGESPTSVTGWRGPLFVANALDRDSPPDTPRPETPLAGTAKRSCLVVSNVISPPAPSPSGPPAASPPYAPPPAALAYLAEKQRLQRNDTMSSGSVYSQPSRAPTPPLPRALSDQARQTTGSGVVVHTDAGPIAKVPSDQPPAYQG